MNNALPTPAAPSGNDPGEGRKVLQQIVAELSEVDDAQITADFCLAAGRLRGSLGRAMLDAKIRRRLGVRIEGLHGLQTFSQLEAAFAGGKTPPPDPGSNAQAAPPPDLLEATSSEAARTCSSLPSPGSGLVCGIDAEAVSSLPEAKDYWTEPFYRTHFADSEIAYCISQPEPRMHFAARWCAKEAYRKCVAGHPQLDMRAIEVARNADGAPYIVVHGVKETVRPPVALSLTHTNDHAWAVVVMDGREQNRMAGEVPGVAQHRSSAFPIALAALLIALAALLLTLIGFFG